MKSPCLGCRALTTNGSYCEVCAGIRQHVRDEQRAESEPWRAAYFTPDWGRAKRQALLRDEHQCRALIDGERCTMDAEAVHHQPSLRELWESGRSPYDLKFLFSVCATCHSRVDARRRATSQRTP